MPFITKCGACDLEDAGMHFKLRTKQFALCSFPRLHTMRNLNQEIKSKAWELNKTPWIFLVIIPRWRNLWVSLRERSWVVFVFVFFFQIHWWCFRRDRLSADFQGAQGHWLCLMHLWPGKDKPSLCLNSKHIIWAASAILGHLEAAEQWMLRKDLGNWEKEWAELSTIPPMKAQNERAQKEEMYGKKKARKNSCIFSGFL